MNPDDNLAHLPLSFYPVDCSTGDSTKLEESGLAREMNAVVDTGGAEGQPPKFLYRDPSTWMAASPSDLRWGPDHEALLYRAVKRANELADKLWLLGNEPSRLREELLGSYGIQHGVTTQTLFDPGSEEYLNDVSMMRSIRADIAYGGDLVSRAAEKFDSVSHHRNSYGVGGSQEPADIGRVFFQSAGLSLLFCFLRTSDDLERCSTALKMLNKYIKFVLESRGKALPAACMSPAAFYAAVALLLLDLRSRLRLVLDAGNVTEDMESFRSAWFSILLNKGILISASPRILQTFIDDLCEDMDVAHRQKDDVLLVHIFGFAGNIVEKSACPEALDILKIVLHDVALGVLEDGKATREKDLCLRLVLNMADVLNYPTCEPEKLKRLVQLILRMCPDFGDPAAGCIRYQPYTSKALAIVASWSRSTCFIPILVEQDTPEILNRALKTKRLNSDDFKVLLPVVRNFCKALERSMPHVVTKFKETVWDIVIDFAARPHGQNQHSVGNFMMVLKLLLELRDPLSSLTFPPIIIGHFLDWYFYDFECDRRKTHPGKSATSCLKISEVFSSIVKGLDSPMAAVPSDVQGAMTHVEVQRSLMLILAARRFVKTSSTFPQNLFQLVLATSNTLILNRRLFAALVEQCVPSEAFILAGGSRSLCLQTYLRASIDFGKEELRRGLEGRGDISAESAAVAYPIIFLENAEYQGIMKDFLFDRNGLDILIDVVFNAAASPKQPKITNRWFYAVNSLHVLCQKSKNISSLLKLSNFPKLSDSNWNEIDRCVLWRCFRPELEAILPPVVLPSIPDPPKTTEYKVPDPPTILPADPTSVDALPASWLAYRSHEFYNLSPALIAEIRGIPSLGGFEGNQNRKKEKPPAAAKRAKKSTNEEGAKRAKKKVEDTYELVFRDGRLVITKDLLLSKSDYFLGVTDGHFVEAEKKSINFDNVCDKATMDKFLQLAPVKSPDGNEDEWTLVNFEADLASESIVQVLLLADLCDYLVRPKLASTAVREAQRRFVVKPETFSEILATTQDGASTESLPSSLFVFVQSARVGVNIEDLFMNYLKSLLVGPMSLQNRALAFRAIAKGDEKLRNCVIRGIRQLLTNAYDVPYR